MVKLYKYSTIDCKHIDFNICLGDVQTIESIYLTNGEKVLFSDINKLFVLKTGEKYLYTWEKNDNKFYQMILRYLSPQIFKLQNLLHEYENQSNNARLKLKENFNEKIKDVINEVE